MTRKTFLFLIPEFYLICATLYYWILTSSLLNPIAIALLAILIFQAISKKIITGLALAVIFIVLNLYMVLALLSELSEFTERNTAFDELLIMGSIFLGLNIVMSIIMFVKYIKRQLYLENHKEQHIA